MIRIPRAVYLGAALWAAGTIAFTTVDHTLTGADNPEHVTQAQQDERQHVDENRVERSQHELEEGLDAEGRERLRPGELRDAEKAIGRSLLRP